MGEKSFNKKPAKTRKNPGFRKPEDFGTGPGH